MPQNSETRIRKNNTLEEFRQKSNDVSLDVGDNKLIDSRILDKTFTFTASNDQAFFESGTLRYEYKSDETLDDTTHQISNPVGRVRVYNGSTEYSQALSGSNTFKTPLYVANIALTGSPTLTEFVENTVVYQAASAQTDLSASAVTFQGKILGAPNNVAPSVADGIRLKTDSGTYNTNQALRVHPGTSGRSVSTDTITSSQHTGKTSIDGTYGRLIYINAGNVSTGDVIKIVSHSLVDAINEVQDDVGDITSLNTNTSADIVASINELNLAIRGGSSQLVASNITTTANDLAGAVNELDSAQGNVALIDDESGYSATTVVGGITELQDHLGTKASLTTTAKGDLVLAINEVDANADASMKLVSSSAQTLNTNLTFGTSGKTLTFGTGTTLDIRSGTLLTGGGAGSSLGFDTAFIDLTPNASIRGLSFERSNHISGAPDVEFRFSETQVSANKEARAFQVKGLNDSGASEVADLVTFYNAKELFANNTETGVAVNWDSTNQNFDINLDADPTIQLAGDLTGSVTLSDLQTTTYTLTSTIAAGSVENSMLAGSIANDKLAGSIANAKLANSSITVSDGSNTSPVALGETLTVQGTSGEVTVAENNKIVTVGLPDNVTIGGNLTITGNLDVNGTQTTINTSTLEVDDTLILLGASNTEPTTGGFGLETRAFTGTTAPHSGAASNVTGTHSIVYNFATDRWEADGSLILSEATLGNASVEGQAFGSGKNLVFAAGSGLSETPSGLSGNTYTITYTNTDKGSDQNIFKNVASDSGTAVADQNNDTLTISGGNFIDTAVSGDTLTINHSDTSSVGDVNNSGNTFVQDITFDTNGHVQSVNSVAVGNLDNYQHWLIDADSGDSEQITSTETVQFIGGTGLTTSRSSNNITTTLDNTAVTAGSYGGSLKLNSFTVDAQGRLTAAADGSTISGTGLISVASNGTISTTADNYSHWNFTTDTSGNETVTSQDTVTFAGGTGITVSHSGDTITITEDVQNSDTNTVLNLNADTGGATSFSGSSSNTVTIAGGTGIDTERSGDSITATLDLNELSTTSTQGDAAFFAVVNSSGNQFKMAPASIPISYFSNNSGFTSNAGTVTQVSGSNGITGTVTGSGSLSLSGSYTGTFDVQGEIRASGDVVAFYSSDERLKDNKSVIENSLDKVGKLKGYEFDWNDKQEVYEGHDVGVIAQEVEKVLPEVVQTRDDGYKAVKYDKLVPLLINAINELKAEIEELKSINKRV